MKKTFQVNINGKIYHIDEDAYSLLQDYLAQLRDAFPGEEGTEIVSDIEFRISEHFDQRVASGANVVVIDDVNYVIGIMGRPDEISEGSELDDEAAGPSSRPDPAPAPAGAASDIPPFRGYTDATPPPYQKKLFRDERHKVFGGVLAGFAQYMDWDVTVLRVLIVVATIALCGINLFWPIILAYLICWMIIPPARSPRQILEMRGEPVTVDNVGQTVIDNSVPPVAPVPEGNGAARVINNIFLVIGRIILVFFGVIGGLVCIGTVMVSLVIIAGICCYYFASSDFLLYSFTGNSSNPYIYGWWLVMVLAAVALPAFCLCRAGIATLFKAPGMSWPSIVAVIVIEAMLIIAACVLASLSNTHTHFF